MGKYEPLSDFLKANKDDAWDASFSEIEDKLGFALPASARRHRAWWANSRNGSHSQAKGWLDADWVVIPGEIDLEVGRVRLERTRAGGRRPANREQSRLREEAVEWSGITDLGELNKAALSALIRREQAKYVASLGGSMPDAEAAPRRRTMW